MRETVCQSWPHREEGTAVWDWWWGAVASGCAEGRDQ